MDIAGAVSKSKNAIVTLEDEDDYEECIKTTMQVYKSRGVQCVLEHENLSSDYFPRSPSINSTSKSGFKLNREKFKYNEKSSNYIHVPKVDCDSLDKWQHDMYYKLEGIDPEKVAAATLAAKPTATPIATPAASCKCEKRRDVYKPPMLRNCAVCGSTAGELPDPRASTTKDTTSASESDVESNVMKYVTQRRHRLSGSPNSSLTKQQASKVEDKSSSVAPKDLKPSILKVRKETDTDSGPKKDRHIAFDLAVDSSKVLTNLKSLSVEKKKIQSREEFFKSMEFVVKPHKDCIRVRHDINLFDVLDKPETPVENVPPPPSGPVENKTKKAVNEYRIKVAEKLRIQNLRKARGTQPSTSRQVTMNPMMVHPQHFFPLRPLPFGVPMTPEFFPRVSQQYRLFKHKPNESLVRYR